MSDIQSSEYKPLRTLDLLKLIGKAIFVRKFGSSSEYSLLLGVSAGDDDEPVALLANNTRVSARELLRHYRLIMGDSQYVAGRLEVDDPPTGWLLSAGNRSSGSVPAWS